MKALILSLLFVLGSSLTPEQEEQIQVFIEEFLQCSDVPGLSLGVVKDGVQELATGYGVADLDTREPVDGTTLFNIASTSKAFATVLLAKQLRENAQYTWNTPVRDILGDDFFYYSGAATNRTMLRDIASHKTGLPRHDYAWLLNAITRQNVRERLRFIDPVYPPRTTFQYTNTMYTLTGIVSEELSEGLSWEDLIQQEFFDPLGMSASTFMYRSLPELTDHATPYERVNGELTKTPWQMYLGLEAFNPAAGISSNAEDMTKWMNFLLGHGPIDNSYVSQTFVPELVSSNSPYYSKPSDPVTMEATNYYARAWYAGHYRGYKTMSHGGDLRGHHTYVYIMPDLDVGIFHTFNFGTAKQQREMVSAYVVDVLLGEETWFTAQDVCAVGRSANMDDDIEDPLMSPPGGVITKNDIQNSVSVRTDDYVGLYGNFYYGNITITTEEVGEDTFLRLLYGEGDYLLSGQGEDLFLTVGNNDLSSRINLGIMSFQKDEFELVESLTVPGMESLDPPVFVKGLDMHDAPAPDLNTC